jgi:FMN phosphatase YigB (HAD superfamily)
VGARAQATLTVGDRLDNDIAPAEMLGMAGILIDREGLEMRKPAVHRIEALTELIGVLDLA